MANEEGGDYEWGSALYVWGVRVVLRWGSWTRPGAGQAQTAVPSQ